jgi:hypothetical protein
MEAHRSPRGDIGLWKTASLVALGTALPKTLSVSFILHKSQDLLILFTV